VPANTGQKAQHFGQSYALHSDQRKECNRLSKVQRLIDQLSSVNVNKRQLMADITHYFKAEFRKQAEGRKKIGSYAAIVGTFIYL